MSTYNKALLFFIPAFFLFSSCVKDIDLDQYKEIVIPPTAAIDLIFFNLSTEDFHKDPSSPYNVRDEVRLEFLDDDYIQKSLVRADLYFKYVNTFPQEITSTITLLSENNSRMHQFSFVIPAGSPENPGVINYTEIVYEENIAAIRRSIKMSVDLEIRPNTEAIEGGLELKSRAFLKFEFR